MGNVLPEPHVVLFILFCLSRGFLYSPDFEGISTGQFF